MQGSGYDIETATVEQVRVMVMKELSKLIASEGMPPMSEIAAAFDWSVALMPANMAPMLDEQRALIALLSCWTGG